MAVPLIIAHRGDSAHRPENTLVAFKRALEVGADIVEFDVQLTKDGEVVVLHDVTVNRTTSGTGSVRDLTLAELKKLDAGFPQKFGSSHAGERIPTLEEALRLLRGRAKVMVEIKRESVTADDDGIEARVIAAVRKTKVESEVALISFERRSLLRCKTQAPEIRRGHIFYREEVDTVLAAAKEVETDLVMPEKGMLSFDLRDRMHDAGIKIATWVVDEPDELRALSHYDLYGVGSNRPGVLLDALWAAD